MSSQYNSFRNRRYLRSRFLDGRFLLSQEASDLQLEILEYARRIVQNSLGDIAIGDAWKAEIVPLSLGISNSQKKLIVRPGTAYYNGLLYEMTSGTDHKVAADANQPVTVGSPNDPGGKIVDFSSRPTGYYKVIVKAQEEKVTADQDTFLKGAAVPENTEEKRRLIYTLSAVPSDVDGNIAGKDPLNFTRTDDLTGTQQSQFFQNNDVFQVDRTPNSITPTSDTLGTDIVVTFSNTNGAGTIFPTGTLMSQVFSGGLFIDPDGAVYFINAVQVTTGPDQISFFLDKEVAVPAGSGLQPDPDLGTSGLKYTLIPADVIIADPSTGLPVGTRNYSIANVYWNGTDFSMSPFGFSSSGGSVQYNIRDLRKTGTGEAIENTSSKQLWQLTGGGDIEWDLSNQKLSWDANLIVKVPNNSSLEYVISASDTFTLFGSNFAEDEVLYFVVPSNTSGSVSVLPQKNARGTGDLASFDPSEIYVLAYRTNNRIHWNNDGLVLSAGETGGLGQSFYNQYLKLVRGDSWAWNASTNTLSWATDAFIQVSGIAENRNKIPAGSAVLTNDGDIAYVTVNRGAGSPATLSVSVANIASVPVQENIFIIARKFGTSVSLPSQTTDTGGDGLNSSTLQRYAQAFTLASSGLISTVALKLSKTGSPTGNITCALQADSGGNPSGIDLYSTTLAASSVAAGPGETPVTITVGATLGAGTYHIVVRGDSTFYAGVSVFNTISVRVNLGSVVTPTVQIFNGSVWSTNATDQFYFVLSGSLSGNSYVTVGSQSFRLDDGESKGLDADVSDQNLTLFGQNITRGTSAPTYSSDIRGVANQGFQERIGANTDALGDEQEDRSLFMRSDLPVTWTGTQIQFISDIIVDITNTKSGTVTTHTIPLADSPLSLNNGESIWVAITRTATSETLTVNRSSVTPVPAQNQTNKDVLILFKRVDSNSVGYLYLPVHKQLINPGQTVRLGASGAGSSGNGTGDDVLGTLFNTDLEDLFDELPLTSSQTLAVDISAGKTNPAAYDVVNALYKLSYDASKTVTGTGTSMTLSATPAYTVAIGDTLVVGVQARRITAIGSINTDGGSGTPFTIESAFTTNPSASACTVSQTLYTKDINNFASDGVAPSTADSSTISTILVKYLDSAAVGQKYPDLNVTPNVGWIASSDGTSYSPVQTRPNAVTSVIQTTGLPTSGTDLFIRFFANKTSGNGTVNVLRYKAYWHLDTSTNSGAVLNTAYTLTNGAGSQINCQAPILVAGKTRIRITAFTYPVGINPGKTVGALKVTLDGKDIDRFVDSTTTPDASYTEVDPQTIDLDTDYTGLSLSLRIDMPVPIIDSGDTNTQSINTLQENIRYNLAYNPEGLVGQRIDPVAGTNVANNAYGADRWKVQVSANNLTVKRVASALPGTRYAMQLQKVTASGFFGQAQFLEANESIPLQGSNVTLSITAKTTSSQVGQIRISVVGWEGTADSPTTNIVSSWASQPTYAANLNQYGTGVFTVTNNYQTFTITVPVGTACNNLIIFVHTTNSQNTGDTLFITGVKMCVGTSALPYVRRKDQEEISMCQRYYEKSWEIDQLAANTPTSTGTGIGQSLVGGSAAPTGGNVSYKVTKRTSTPSTTIYSPSNGASGVLFDASSSTNVASTAASSGAQGFQVSGSFTSNHTLEWQWASEADF